MQAVDQQPSYQFVAMLMLCTYACLGNDPSRHPVPIALFQAGTEALQTTQKISGLY